MSDSGHSDLLAQFRGISGVSEEVATRFLQQSGWNLEGAMNSFFESGQTFDMDFTDVAPAAVERVEDVAEVVKMDSVGLYDKTHGTRVHLSRQFVSVVLTDYLQTTIFRRIYKNGTDSPVEMTCVFSAGRSVHKVVIELFDPETEELRRIRAESTPKQEAQERYDDGLSEGNVAALLEQNEVSERLVTLQIGNVNPGIEVRIISRSVDVCKMCEEEEEGGGEDSDDSLMWLECSVDGIRNVDVESNEMEVADAGIAVKNTSLWFGIRLEHGFVAAGVDAAAAEAITSIDETCLRPKSPSHSDVALVVTREDAVTEEDGGVLAGMVSIRPEEEFISLTKDFILRIPIKQYPVASLLVQKLPVLEQEKYSHVGMIAVIPKNGKIGGQEDEEEEEELSDLAVMSEMILIVDCSGSMSGSRIRCARDAGKLFLQSLDPSDQIRLNIVRFGSVHESMFPNPQQLTPETFQRAMRYMDDTRANLRQTDILSPLKMVLETPTEPGYSRQVFLLTDGEDAHSLRIVKMAKSHCRATRVFCLGIGNEINTFLIRELAAATNAKSTFLSQSSEIRSSVMAQLSYAVRPSVRQLEISFDESSYGRTERVSASVPPWIYANQRFVDYYYLEQIPETPEPVQVSYVVGAPENESTVTARILPRLVDPTPEGHAHVAILAASRKIEELQIFGKNKVVDKANIRRLALQYNLLSSETSFIVVSEQEIAIQDELRVENVPSVPYVGGEERQQTSRGSESAFDTRLFDSEFTAEPLLQHAVPQAAEAFQGFSFSAADSREDRPRRTNRRRRRRRSRGRGRGRLLDFAANFDSPEAHVASAKEAKEKKTASGDIFAQIRRLPSGGKEEKTSGRQQEARSMMHLLRERIAHRRRRAEEGAAATILLSDSSSSSSSESGSDDSDDDSDGVPPRPPPMTSSLDFLEIDEGASSIAAGAAAAAAATTPTVVPRVPSQSELDAKLGSIEGGDLEKIMYMQSLDGLWPSLDAFVAEVLHFDMDEVRGSNPLEATEDSPTLSFWITGLVVAVLRLRFGEEAISWRLIVRKAQRALKRNRVFSAVIGPAREFVQAH